MIVNIKQMVLYICFDIIKYITGKNCIRLDSVRSYVR